MYIPIEISEKLYPGMDTIMAGAVFNDLDDTVNKFYQNDFSNIICKVPGTKLQLKKSSA